MNSFVQNQTAHPKIITITDIRIRFNEYLINHTP